MTIIVRIAAVLGAIWSLVVLGVMTTVGALVSFLGLFNRAHTGVFLSVAIGLEIVLLFALWHAGKLRVQAAPVILFWFVAFSALINTPFVLREWPQLLWGALVYFLPITLTMLLLTVHGVAAYIKDRQGNHRQNAEATPHLV